MKIKYLLPLFFAACSPQAPAPQSNLPPAIQVGNSIQFKTDGIRMSEWSTYKILAIKGNFVHLQEDLYGACPPDVLGAIQAGRGGVLLKDRLSDVGWFNVDKMNNIILVK